MLMIAVVMQSCVDIYSVCLCKCGKLVMEGLISLALDCPLSSPQ